MHFHRRAPGWPVRLGILSGAFHPPTTAHLMLAHAGLAEVEEVLFVLPRIFPHKPYEDVSFEDRLRMLEAAAAGEPRFSIASTVGGLFIEIARECHAAYGPQTRLEFLCGRDAAERIVNWDYGEPGAIRRMLEEFGLLVASRQGAYEPPADLRSRIRPLPVPPGFDEVSATYVRDRIAAGEPWEHLVPGAIVSLVRELYGQERSFHPPVAGSD